MSSIKHELSSEVQRLNDWARETYGILPISTPWGEHYPHWPALHAVFQRYLAEISPAEWTDTDEELLLDLLARDYESRELQVALMEKPQHLLRLVRAGHRSRQRLARLQLADALFALPDSQHTEAEFRAYLNDPDPQVRHLAGIAQRIRLTPKASDDDSHCCDYMQNTLAEGEAGIDYDAKFRAYGIPVFDGGNSHLVIRFCPWCGTRLPDNLRDKWFSVVEQELAMDADGPLLPPEMQSSAWWKRRGL